MRGKKRQHDTDALRIECTLALDVQAGRVTFSLRQLDQRLTVPLTPAEARTIAGGLLGAAKIVDPSGHDAATVAIVAELGPLRLETFPPESTIDVEMD